MPRLTTDQNPITWRLCAAGCACTIAVAVAIAVAQVSHTRKLAAARQKWKADWAAMQAADWALNRAFWSRYDQFVRPRNHGKSPPWDEVRACLPTAPVEKPPDGVFTYVDPSTGGHLKLLFEDGLWTGTVYPGTAGAPTRQPPAVDVKPHERVTALRRGALYAAHVGWLLLFVWWMGIHSDSQRRRVAPMLLALAVVAILLAAAGPTGWGTIFAFRGSNPGGYALIMAQVSVVLIAVGLHGIERSKSQSPRCHACGYDLTGNVSGTCPECGTRRRQRFATAWG